ncbi:MAG: histidine kinase [Planctomycetota bacterium]|nr:MAG: histidine kinase [Planctomycetota bacterium]REJ88951.1 MAG: histidine kinase [Planctomycetota bacterium]
MDMARLSRAWLRRSLYGFVIAAASVGRPVAAETPEVPSPVIQITANTQRLEMTAKSSRILTVDYKIPQAQVNNPDILELRALSPSQLQLFAKRPGVTQVNIWDEENNVKSMDVIVYGDAQELSMHLRSQFPSSALRVVPLANSVVVSGTVDRPEQVRGVMEIAGDYYPKVINNITVSGVQQVLLHVKVMEVSRTKLRTLGFDFGATNGSDFLVSSISGLISASAASSGSAVGLGGDTVRFGFVDGNNAFFGFLEALRQHDLMKILAEPTLVTVSGRAASFQSGGEFPILIPQSLGTVSIEYKRFGTQVDFVPIVLGNGRIRLEVRPRVSEIDETRSVTINDITVPGLRVREVDTGVEMQAGQTLALAGLVQNRIEARNLGIPALADLPYVGAAFRRVTEENNEIELLILVTPELVEAMDCHEVPPGGPGLNTASPRDCDLYWRGHLEVPLGGGPHGRGGHCGPECGPEGQPHYVPHGPHGGYEQPVPSGEAIPPGVESSRLQLGVPMAAQSAQPWPSQMINASAAGPSRLSTLPAEANAGGPPRVPASSRRQVPREEDGFIGPRGYDVTR